MTNMDKRINNIVDKMYSPKSPHNFMIEFERKMERRWEMLYLASLILTPISIGLGFLLWRISK